MKPDPMKPYLLLTWHGTEGAQQRTTWPVDRVAEALEQWRLTARDSWTSGATLSLVTPIAMEVQP